MFSLVPPWAYTQDYSYGTPTGLKFILPPQFNVSKAVLYFVGSGPFPPFDGKVVGHGLLDLNGFRLLGVIHFQRS